jgi:hypothetical protein
MNRSWSLFFKAPLAPAPSTARRRRPRALTLGVLLAVSSIPFTGLAADHGDAPAGSERTADITDLYAWMTSDTSKLNLVMGVASGATASTTFSNAVTYVFHVSSMQGYGQPQQATDIICKFADSVNIECWLGGEYVAGDPSSPEGITSQSGKVRVFAGLRDDPFFLEYTGFANAVTTATAAAAAGDVTFDANGCAQLSAEQQGLVVGQLTHGENGAPPSNTFAGQSVLALVLQVDKSLVTVGGPLLGVWASTHSGS